MKIYQYFISALIVSLASSYANAATSSLGSDYQCKNGILTKRGRTVSVFDTSVKIASSITKLSEKLSSAQKAKASSAKISNLKNQIKLAKKLKSGIDKCGSSKAVDPIWATYIAGFSEGNYSFDKPTGARDLQMSLQVTDLAINKKIRIQFFLNGGLGGYCRGEFAGSTEINNIAMPRVFGTSSNVTGDSEFTIGSDGLFLASKINNPELPEVACRFTGKLEAGKITGTFVVTTGSLNQDASGSFVLSR